MVSGAERKQNEMFLRRSVMAEYCNGNTIHSCTGGRWGENSGDGDYYAISNVIDPSPV